MKHFTVSCLAALEQLSRCFKDYFRCLALRWATERVYWDPPWGIQVFAPACQVPKVNKDYISFPPFTHRAALIPYQFGQFNCQIDGETRNFLGITCLFTEHSKIYRQVLKRTYVKNFPRDHQFCNKTNFSCIKSWLNPNQLLLISRILSFVPFSH